MSASAKHATAGRHLRPRLSRQPRRALRPRAAKARPDGRAPHAPRPAPLGSPLGSGGLPLPARPADVQQLVPHHLRRRRRHRPRAVEAFARTPRFVVRFRRTFLPHNFIRTKEVLSRMRSTRTTRLALAACLLLLAQAATAPARAQANSQNRRAAAAEAP